MSLKIRKVSYPMGAEIMGVDIRKALDAATLREVRAAFLDCCLLLFRGTPLTSAQFTAFSRLFGQPDAGTDMTFDFATLLAHAAKTRPLCAGTVLGSGTVANRDTSRGSSCIAERRMLEILADGKPSTAFLRAGDRVRIEMRDADGASIFGAIDQLVRAAL